MKSWNVAILDAGESTARLAGRMARPAARHPPGDSMTCSVVSPQEQCVGSLGLRNGLLGDGQIIPLQHVYLIKAGREQIHRTDPGIAQNLDSDAVVA